MSTLTAEQLKKIEENKRIALERRQKHLSSVSSSTATIAKPLLPQKLPVQTNHFYKSKPVNGIQPYLNKTSNQVAKAAPAATVKECSAVCTMVSSERFGVEMTYHEQTIEIMKTVNGRLFDNSSKMWTFPISEHDTLISKLAPLRPKVSITGLPKSIVSCFKMPMQDVGNVNIDKIDPNLLNILMPFQLEGVKFGVSRRGRCLIADDMGLGKTIQALGIAHYFEKDWPFLIVCPSSMRFPWEEAIHRFLPTVNPFSIIVMTTAHDEISYFNIVITSYDLLKTALPAIKKKKFGTLIFDESHFLKSRKSGRTKAALELTPSAKHVILLSGTPALSRPQELYPQIQAIDPATFLNFSEFGMRYCDGKQNRFGWDFSGSSNSTELELLLKRKFMLRRLKSEVLGQLPAKLRKVIILHPKMVKAVSKQMAHFASEMEGKKGMEKRGTLLQYYCATGTAKLDAVKEYIHDKLENPGKMLVFAHHTQVMDGLEEMCVSMRVDYIRIDGTTCAEARASLCERFQTEPTTRVALLSIKAANAGLTLTAAHLVLFAELYWNPGELTQAEDRAHRIGQLDSVLVEYLVAKGTADDFLWALVESKLRVLNSVGLSKDSFKDSGQEHVRQKDQPTIPELFACEETGENLENQPHPATSQVSDDFSDAFADDACFDSLDLANIDCENGQESKKPKLS